MAQVMCVGCGTGQQVPDTATRFRCATCGTDQRFVAHDCGTVTAIPAADVAWRCPGCGKMAGQVAVAALGVASKVAGLWFIGLTLFIVGLFFWYLATG